MSDQKESPLLQWVIPLNWTLGTLLLVVAAFYPYVERNFLLASKKKVAEVMVAQIFKIEEQTRSLKQGNLVLFGLGKLPEEIASQFQQQDESGFLYEAFVDESGSLVIRAQPGDELLRKSEMPPIMYQYRKHFGSKQASGEWVKL